MTAKAGCAFPRAVVGGRFARTGLVCLIAGLVAWSAGTRVDAGELTDQQVLERLTKDHPRDRAIRKALAWLRTQQEEDGSVGAKHPTAMTSLAVMAHLSAGIMFDDPEHGTWLRKSLAYVLQQQEADGYFGKADNSRMYGHGMTTLMLAEAFDMARDEALEERIRRALASAVGLTVRAAQVKKDAKSAGGWRYQPTSKDADMSLSGWQLMSLHAAHQVGMTVPEEVIQRAVAYADRCTTKDGHVGYQPGKKSAALRGLGMLCFVIGGQEKAEVIDRIAGRIQQNPIRWQGQWFFYRVYYDAMGMSRARAEAWAAYSPVLEKVLLEHQKADGTWPTPPGNNEGGHGTVYTTCMALLALTVERHVLPAYQR